MAVTSIPVTCDLVLVMDNGVNAAGQATTKSRTYKNVKSAATNDDVYAVAQAFIGLQSKASKAIQRRNIVELSNQ